MKPKINEDEDLVFYHIALSMGELFQHEVASLEKKIDILKNAQKSFFRLKCILNARIK